MKYLSFLLLFVSVFISCNINTTLLDEYKLLYTDIENLYTYGYKSYYNHELSRATFEINDSQGSLLSTEYNYDCAIIGKGFFKIKLNDDVGYTRNGQFKVDEKGELLISNGYSLYESIYLPMYFLPDSFIIKSNHEIYISIIEGKNINEINIGQLKTFDIQVDLLEYYQDGIYKLRKDTAKEEEIIIDNKIYNVNKLRVHIRGSRR
jgi:flagellar basal body rod protein FlgG